VKNLAAIHHLDLNVSDLDRSGPFYDSVLTLIGFRRINLSAPGEPPGFDWAAPSDTNRPMTIGIYAAKNPGHAHDRYAPGLHHLALSANSRDNVDRLYRMLLEIRAEILDAPREYPKYEPGYYAVFFLDPDGLKLEYVFTPAG
jgi:catechol 2,3-dioxygenase-like lactoylglutathione lyase family enzyme